MIAAVDLSPHSVGDWFSDSHRWPALAALAAAVVLTGQPLAWHVLRNVVTIAHESGHAVAAVAVRRQLAGVRLHSDTSGVTLSRGRPTGPGMILTAFAGYPAPSLLGVGAAYLVGAGDISVLLWIMVGLLALLLTQIRNAFGLLTVVGTGAAAVAVIIWGGPHLELAFSSVLAWLLLVGGLRAVVELQRTRARQQGRRVPVGALQSDADQLARLSHLPGLVWVGLFWLLAAAALLYGGYLMLK
jgi:hypothetical protein